MLQLYEYTSIISVLTTTLQGRNCIYYHIAHEEVELVMFKRKLTSSADI